MKPSIVPLGDSAALIQLGETIHPSVNQRVRALAKRIEASAVNGLIETVPAYTTVLVQYDPLILSFAQLKNILQEKIDQTDESASRKPRLLEIPVRYGGAYGVDLETVARHLHLSVADIIRIHSAKIYTVYMMGFMPGYPYMGELDSALVMPRLETPRARVAAGTIAIAGSQTGIYSVESPGGWRLIGWTPLILFDSKSESPFLFSPGDEVKFFEER
ncbi:MAG: 5-oxoprolinase subunit PxpB [Anaerolineaceae bacterium]|jgi:KipI family sensor histidine kinase inhibitor|nr:5-oxoprolinase subunit PxpB [Anaerolineaceae bacterium]OQY90434.1 MAG: hypothetical protein B6D38_03835 [Anaerolineae bacterium UTCFX1]